MCLNYHEKLYDLYTKVKLIIFTKCLDNYNIPEPISLNHLEEWHDLYTKMKLIIYSKYLSNNNSMFKLSRKMA